MCPISFSGCRLSNITPPSSSPANLSYESFNSLIDEAVKKERGNNDESFEKVEDSNSERTEGGGNNTPPSSSPANHSESNGSNSIHALIKDIQT
jgi:hypothetical protein